MSGGRVILTTLVDLRLRETAVSADAETVQKGMVLIVDDEPTNIQAMFAPLKDGFAGRFATTGGKAVAMARDLRPDVVLLDVNMPGMDGFAVLTALRADEATRGSLVVFVSGTGDEDIVERAMAAGADDFLVKPCPPALLRRRVERLVELSTLRRSAPAAAPPVRPRPAGGQQVLVVEDGEINRVILSEMLGAMGHTTTLAESGEAGLALAAERAFDAVLLDIHLPGIDGIEVARRLRAGGSRTERPWIVAVTGDVLPGSVPSFHAAGFDAVVRKPVEPESLAAALRGEPAPLPRGPLIEEPALPDLLIDHERLGMLKETYGGPRLPTLFALFERETTSYTTALESALASGDEQKVRATAHRLKSALGHFACARGSALADRIAHGPGRTGDLLRRDVEALVLLLPETVRALRGALDLPAP